MFRQYEFLYWNNKWDIEGKYPWIFMFHINILHFIELFSLFTFICLSSSHYLLCSSPGHPVFILCTCSCKIEEWVNQASSVWNVTNQKSSSWNYTNSVFFWFTALTHSLLFRETTRESLLSTSSTVWLCLFFLIFAQIAWPATPSKRDECKWAGKDLGVSPHSWWHHGLNSPYNFCVCCCPDSCGCSLCLRVIPQISLGFVFVVVWPH